MACPVVKKQIGSQGALRPLAMWAMMCLNKNEKNPETVFPVARTKDESFPSYSRSDPPLESVALCFLVRRLI
ncbi:hypothetical protein CCP2SC5_160047 [Azospirillaceae bacterium]